jgi:hypothetical protein
VSDFVKIQVFAERTECRAWGGPPITVTTNEVEEIIVPLSRIIQIIPKNEAKCLVDIDTGSDVDRRWCVMSADEVMAFINQRKGNQL